MDIIENNTIFVLPLKYGIYAEICAERIEGDEFIEAYKKGAFAKVDFVKSEFGVNVLSFRWKNRYGRIIKKRMYLTKHLNNLLWKYTNEGRKYY